MRAKVLATDLPAGDEQLLRSSLAAGGADLVVSAHTDPDSLAAAAVDVDAIMTCFAHVPAAVLNAATRCRTVARFGVGVDNIDVSRATELGMIVTNVPDYCADEVADHVLMLMLALARRLPSYLTGGGNAPTPVRLAGKTLGIVGLGSIGERIVPRAHALGMRVLALSRSQPTTAGVNFAADLEELLAASDFVTLHAPLNDQTRGLIGAGQLALMKPTAFLINTARGSLVDSAALATALTAGKLAGAGLDVTDPEPLPANSPLRGVPNIILTPHVAYASDGSLQELITRAAQNVIDVLQERPSASTVNPQALANRRDTKEVHV